MATKHGKGYIEARAKVAAASWVPVEGTTDRYLRLVDGDGWAAAGLLVPDAVAARLGAPDPAAARP